MASSLEGKKQEGSIPYLNGRSYDDVFREFCGKDPSDAGAAYETYIARSNARIAEFGARFKADIEQQNKDYRERMDRLFAEQKKQAVAIAVASSLEGEKQKGSWSPSKHESYSYTPGGLYKDMCREFFGTELPEAGADYEEYIAQITEIDARFDAKMEQQDKDFRDRMDRLVEDQKKQAAAITDKSSEKMDKIVEAIDSVMANIKQTKELVFRLQEENLELRRQLAEKTQTPSVAPSV
jgi:hypothetical protein